MRKLNFKEDVLPHIAVIGIFIVIVALYFSPVFFEHKQIKQHDILQAAGSAQEIKEYKAATGKQALWTNSMFSGMPAFMILIDFPGEFIKNTFSEIQYFFPHPAGIVLIHFICFYILLLSFGVRPIYAAIGAVAFGLASFTIISLGAGHNNKVKAMGYAALILAGITYAFRNKIILGFVITALGVALQVGSNHYQITYYLGLIILIYGINQLIYAIKEKQLTGFFKQVVALVFAAIIGLGANAGSFMTTLEYAKYSQRGKPELKSVGGKTKEDTGGLDKEYAFSYSYGKFETFSLLIPNVLGGASAGSLSTKSEVYQTLKNNYQQVNAEQFIEQVPLYWGNQPQTGGPTYYGAIIIFLFVLGMFILDKRVKYWLLAVTIFSIFLAWGKNFETFNYLVFDLLPGYNKFRAVTMTLIMGHIAVTLGAILALYKIFETGFTKDIQKKLFISFGITGGLCLFFILFAGSFDTSAATDTQYFGQAPELISALKKDRASLLRADAFRSFFFILLAAALVWAAITNKLKKQIALIVIGLLVLADMWFVDKRYLNENGFERKPMETFFTPTAANEAILADKSLDYRVLNLTTSPWNDARTSYFHKSLGGYHAAKIGRYMDFIEHVFTPEIEYVIDNLKKGSTDFSNAPGLNMINTKYLIVSDQANGAVENKSALGNAWFISEIKKVNSPDEEITAIKGLDPSMTAVIDVSKFKISKDKYSKDSTSAIKLTSYSPNELEYESTSASDGFGVFAEVFYPEGWVATIDGKEAEIKRANYILRALEIPAGKHKIKFEFLPKSYATGNTIAYASSIILLIAVAGGVFMAFRKKES
jgi:hypothetical protein